MKLNIWRKLGIAILIIALVISVVYNIQLHRELSESEGQIQIYISIYKNGQLVYFDKDPLVKNWALIVGWTIGSGGNDVIIDKAGNTYTNLGIKGSYDYDGSKLYVNRDDASAIVEIGTQGSPDVLATKVNYPIAQLTHTSTSVAQNNDQFIITSDWSWTSDASYSINEVGLYALYWEDLNPNASGNTLVARYILILYEYLTTAVNVNAQDVLNIRFTIVVN